MWLAFFLAVSLTAQDNHGAELLFQKMDAPVAAVAVFITFSVAIATAAAALATSATKVNLAAITLAQQENHHYMMGRR